MSAFAPHCPSAIHHPPAPPPPFPFLNLPSEIRQHISTLIILSSSPITIHEPKFNRHPKRKRAPSPPLIPTPAPSPPPDAVEEDPAIGHTRLALLLTCRVLYRENWKTYYRHNTFFFTLSTLPPFLSAIPARCRNQICRIQFRMPYKHRLDRVWATLATMERLEELELWLHPPTTARHSEWESCIAGARDCERLRILRLKREEGPRGDDGEPWETESAILEKDRAIEEKVREFLEERQRIREQGKELKRKNQMEGNFETSEEGEE